MVELICSKCNKYCRFTINGGTVKDIVPLICGGDVREV